MLKTEDYLAIPGRCSKCRLGNKCAFYSSPGFQLIAEERYYSPGYTVFSQRQAAEYVYVVREGWLELSHHAATARNMTELAGPNSVLGLVEAMTGTSFSVTATTIGSSILEVVEIQRFLDFLKENPSTLFKLSTHLSMRFQKIMHSFYDMAGKISAQKRLMRVFHEIAESCGIQDRTGIRIDLPLTVQTLADKLGCSRQYTSKLIGNLKSRGLIDRKNGWFIITLEGMDSRSKNGAPPR